MFGLLAPGLTPVGASPWGVWGRGWGWGECSHNPFWVWPHNSRLHVASIHAHFECDPETAEGMQQHIPTQRMPFMQCTPSAKFVCPCSQQHAGPKVAWPHTEKGPITFKAGALHSLVCKHVHAAASRDEAALQGWMSECTSPVPLASFWITLHWNGMGHAQMHTYPEESNTLGP